MNKLFNKIAKQINKKNILIVLGLFAFSFIVAGGPNGVNVTSETIYIMILTIVRIKIVKWIIKTIRNAVKAVSLKVDKVSRKLSNS